MSQICDVDKKQKLKLHFLAMKLDQQFSSPNKQFSEKIEHKFFVDDISDGTQVLDPGLKPRFFPFERVRFFSLKTRVSYF